MKPAHINPIIAQILLIVSLCLGAIFLDIKTVIPVKSVARSRCMPELKRYLLDNAFAIKNGVITFMIHTIGTNKIQRMALYNFLRVIL